MHTVNGFTLQLLSATGMVFLIQLQYYMIRSQYYVLSAFICMRSPDVFNR